MLPLTYSFPLLPSLLSSLTSRRLIPQDPSPQAVADGDSRLQSGHSDSSRQRHAAVTTPTSTTGLTHCLLIDQEAVTGSYQSFTVIDEADIGRCHPDICAIKG